MPKVDPHDFSNTRKLRIYDVTDHIFMRVDMEQYINTRSPKAYEVLPEKYKIICNTMAMMPDGTDCEMGGMNVHRTKYAKPDDVQYNRVSMYNMSKEEANELYQLLKRFNT